jgi:hypothetical protein
MATPSSEIASPPATNTSLDPRIVRLDIEVNGQIKTYENLFISAVGVRYGNPLQNECEITIYNLDKATQSYILSETTPYNDNHTAKTVRLYAGRQSYGTTLIYVGNVVYSGITQPPDIGVILRCLTGNFLKMTTINVAQPGQTTTEQISKALSESADLILNFQATDKLVSNYAYTGSVLQQIEAVAALGYLNVFSDNDELIVKDGGVPLRGEIKEVSAATGMIGIPELIEQGIRVKFFIDNKTTLGQGIHLVSEQYPAINGIYVIYQLAFIITNRLTPFYFIADCAIVRSDSLEATNG